jgi:hypothetical protein|tara:strand:+ start:401 stop:697 length:297 start_codon:yes stop_codon:yes gene_type:complete
MSDDYRRTYKTVMGKTKRGDMAIKYITEKGRDVLMRPDELAIGIATMEDVIKTASKQSICTVEEIRSQKKLLALFKTHYAPIEKYMEENLQRDWNGPA